MNETLVATEGEDALLESLERKLQVIRDGVKGVVRGYHNGLYLWGEGGISKSYTVVEALKDCKRLFKVTSSRLTARGLFELLRDAPDITHVLEDVETLFSDKNASGVLRGALWGLEDEHGVQQRFAEWVVSKKREKESFTGGIIMVMNCPLDDLPQLRALKTRVNCLRFDVTRDEIAARMRQIAREGYRFGLYTLLPEDGLEVAEEIIALSHRLQHELDLRLLMNTFRDRIQWANGDSETHWRDLLNTRMKERVILPQGDYLSQSARTEQERAIARRIAQLPRKERLAAWKKETGKSEPALYRRLNEIGVGSRFSHFSQDQRWTDN
jgi:hypothetical protein